MMADSKVERTETSGIVEFDTSSLHTNSLVDSADGGWMDGLRTPSLHASESVTASGTDLLVRDPGKVLNELLTAGVDVAKAGDILLSYYQSLSGDNALQTKSQVSSQSSRSLRIARWRQDMSVMPDERGSCYLHVIRWARRPRFRRDLGLSPLLQDFISMLHIDDLDLEAVNAVYVYRVAGPSGFGICYHMARTGSVGECVGTFSQVLSCMLRLYPFISTMKFQSHDDTLETFPLIGRVGLLFDSGPSSSVVSDNCDDLRRLFSGDTDLLRSNTLEISSLNAAVTTTLCFSDDTVAFTRTGFVAAILLPSSLRWPMHRTSPIVTYVPAFAFELLRSYLSGCGVVSFVWFDSLVELELEHMLADLGYRSQLSEGVSDVVMSFYIRDVEIDHRRIPTRLSNPIDLLEFVSYLMWFSPVVRRSVSLSDVLWHSHFCDVENDVCCCACDIQFAQCGNDDLQVDYDNVKHLLKTHMDFNRGVPHGLTTFEFECDNVRVVADVMTSSAGDYITYGPLDSGFTLLCFPDTAIQVADIPDVLNRASNRQPHIVFLASESIYRLRTMSFRVLRNLVFVRLKFFCACNTDGCFGCDCIEDDMHISLVDSGVYPATALQVDSLALSVFNTLDRVVPARVFKKPRLVKLLSELGTLMNVSSLDSCDYAGFDI